MELKIGTRVEHKGQCNKSYGKGTIRDCYEHDFEGRPHKESEWRVDVTFDDGTKKTFLRDIIGLPANKLPRIDILKA